MFNEGPDALLATSRQQQNGTRQPRRHVPRAPRIQGTGLRAVIERLEVASWGAVLRRTPTHTAPTRLPACRCFEPSSCRGSA